MDELQSFRNTYFLKDKMEIKYYCHKRKKYFRNIVKVYLDLAVQRKISGLTFDLLWSDNSKHPNLVIKTFDGVHAIVGDLCSIPGFLFGPEYWSAHRVRVENNFDFRKSSFIPIAGAAERYYAKHQKTLVQHRQSSIQG